MITSAAQRAGFGGGIVVDYPNSRKARKMYLVLMVGQQAMPEAIEDAKATRQGILNERRRNGRGKKLGKGKKDLGVKDWVLKKKELYRQRGKDGFVVFIFASRV